MSEITLFENPQFGKVRVIMRGSDLWFVGSDVATCLGYSNPEKAVRDHCKKAEAYAQFGDQLATGVNDSFTLMDSQLPKICSPLAPQTKFIPEPDVYRLVMHSSQLDHAVEFRRWVAREIFNDPILAARAWIAEYKAKQKAQAALAQEQLVDPRALLAGVL